MLEDYYAPGLKLRKEKLGAGAIEKAISSTTDVSRPIQDFATEVCWGFLWQRDQLSHRDRSLLNLAISSTLNRADEFKAQVKVAVANGLTTADISEAAKGPSITPVKPPAITSSRLRSAKETRFGEFAYETSSLSAKRPA